MALNGPNPSALRALTANFRRALELAVKIVARVLGEVFRHKHQRVAVELSRHIQPLLLALNGPASAPVAATPPPSPAVVGH